MKLTLLWALPFVSKFALARPADGDSLLEFGTLESLTGAKCRSTEVCSKRPWFV